MLRSVDARVLGRYQRLNFLHYSWVAHMKNTFDTHDIPVIAFQPILSYYSLGAGDKWHQLGKSLLACRSALPCIAS